MWSDPQIAAPATPDAAAIRDAVQVLHPTGVVELRVPNLDGRGRTASGYFNQPLALAEAALRYQRRAEGVYLTLNDVPESLLARSNNQMREGAAQTTTDAEVTRRRWLPIDLDPVRPSGISSNRAEWRAAQHQAAELRAWLAQELGWPSPILADSGNGAHLLYALDLPNDAESTALLKAVLSALQARWESAAVKLDQSVLNAGRIWKLYGTVARKGQHLPERPHRRATIIAAPEPLIALSREQLERLAAQAPAPPRAMTGGGLASREAALLAWLGAHGASIRQTKREGERTIFELTRCPFAPNHSAPGKACVTLSASGAFGFKCQTAGCAEQHWQELRALWGDGPALSPGRPEHEPTRQPTPPSAIEELRLVMERPAEPTLWVVPDLLPEGLTLLAAKPKLGKSWMALGLALAVAAGGEALGRRVERGAVLYLALEDSLKRLARRASQLLGGQAAPAGLYVSTTCPKLDDGGLGLMDTWLAETPGARLVIVDTLARVRGQARGASAYADDYASLEAVQQLAQRHSAAILIIHHTGKESRDDALDEVNATQGLNGVADNVLVLRRERGRLEATLIGDGRELPGVELSLRFSPETGAWSLTEPPPVLLANSPEGDAVLRFLLLLGQPAGPGEVAAALGIGYGAATMRLTRLEKARRVVDTGRGGYLPSPEIQQLWAASAAGAQVQAPADTCDVSEVCEDASASHTPCDVSEVCEDASASLLHTHSVYEEERETPGAQPRPNSHTSLTSQGVQNQTPDDTPDPPAGNLLHVSGLEELASLLASGQPRPSAEAIVRAAARHLWQRDPTERDKRQAELEAWLAPFGLRPTEDWEDWLNQEQNMLHYEVAILYTRAARQGAPRLDG